jgi:CTP synthase (UTP-ammonia lyase)
VISKLSCSLVGTSQAVTILPGTLAYRAYGAAAATEQFACNYGLNPAYQQHFRHGTLTVAGRDTVGEARIVELGTHRFFLATLFLPQLSSSLARPHPLIVAYLQAAQRFHALSPGRMTT